MNVIFLGGIFDDQDKPEIISSSKGTVQYAADTLQKNYIDGFCQALEVGQITVMNLPFIGAYPRRYEQVFFRPKQALTFRGRAKILNIGFFNFILIKNFYRMCLAAKAIFSEVAGRESRYTVVCYSMHLPFLLACQAVKWVFGRRIHLCVIVPDLPEYMAVRTGISKFLFSLLSRVSYFIVNRADSVVAITEDMLKKFDARVAKVVIEGIADTQYISSAEVEDKENYYLYTGTLDSRYGIRNLVDSFMASGVKNYELLICGDGNDRPYVERIAAMGQGVKYLGQLDRDAVLKLQRRASLLINPRDNESAYTKYSFPSKIIEYMSSGVPVLMYRLDGIPQAYYDHCYVVPEGRDGLAEKIRELSQLDKADFIAVGASAKRFIAENKMPAAQVEKLIDVFRRDEHV